MGTLLPQARGDLAEALVDGVDVGTTQQQVPGQTLQFTEDAQPYRAVAAGALGRKNERCGHPAIADPLTRKPVERPQIVLHPALHL